LFGKAKDKSHGASHKQSVPPEKVCLAGVACVFDTVWLCFSRMALRPAKAAVEAVTLQLLLKKSTFGFWFVILCLREFPFCLLELGQSASDSENSHAKGSVCVARFSWGDTRRFSRSFQRAQAIFQRELECACVFVSNILRLCADYQRSSPVVSVKINEAQEAAAQRDGGSRLHRCVCFSCLTRRVVFRGLRHIEGCFGSAGQNDRSGWRFDCV
jgi:hypothetical protein